MGQTEPGVSMHLPLQGFRILSAEQYGAGPYGTMLLAQLGAEVIKIEPPVGGDTARAVGPYFLREAESIYFQSFNLNKRSMTLDIRTPEGREILHRLVRTADVMANNQRGDLPAKLGLTYAALEGVNPSIVCAHLSAYGRNNARSAWPGYDYLMQAEAGFLSLTGEPDGPPARFGLSMVDFMTGAMMATGLLAALLDAQRTGRGRDVDVDLLSTALHQTSYPAIWYMNEGEITTRAPRSAHPSVTPSQLFKSADGWLFVMAQLPKFWSTLIELIGRPELGRDRRFSTPGERLVNRDVLTAELDGVFVTQPTTHWVNLLAGRVPVAPVNDIAQALDNPFVADKLTTVNHPDRKSMRVMHGPIRLDQANVPVRAAPLLGNDTNSLLAELGYDEGAAARLRSEGIV